jgi:iron complex outermembrane receptor protein
MSLSVCALLIGTLAAPASMAQEAQAREQTTGGLAEVVVTAERRAASLQDVPIAVSVLDAVQLENRQVTSPQDLQRFVPSLKMSNNITSPTNLSPSMRGSTVQDASLIVAESPFGVYVDDVYVARLNGNNIRLSDIDQIEVLRGPQGTLYGRNTLAGAIKYSSRIPGEDKWLNVSAGAGNYSQYFGAFSAGGPIADKWAGSLSGRFDNIEGEFSNILTGADADHQENWAARGRLRYMGDSFDALLTYSYTDSTNDSLPLVPRNTPSVPANRQFTDSALVPNTIPGTIPTPANIGFYDVATPAFPYTPAPITNPPSGDTQQSIAALALTFGSGSTKFRSITGYVDLDDFFATDFSGRGTIVGAIETADHHWSQEFQLLGTTMDDRLNYIVGAYYFEESGDQTESWFFFSPSSSSVISAETKSLAFYGQVDFAFTNNWSGTFGLRWTEDDKDFSIAQTILPTILPLPIVGPPTDSVTLSNKYSEWTPRFGVEYTVDPVESVDSALFYLTATKGFKSGGYNAIAIFNLNDARTPYFPETNWTYEGGAKLEFLDRRARVNVNYFYNDISNLQLNATAGGGTSFPVQNAGEAVIQGLEADLTFLPVDGLTVFLNAALLEGKYTELNPSSAPAQAPAAYGVQPQTPQVPDYTYTLGFDYALDFSMGSMPSQFQVGASWFRSDDYVTAATNDFLVTGYNRYDGYIGLGIGDHWDLRFAAKNINDSEKITSGSRALGGFIALRPREYLFSVSYSFL